MMTNTNQTEIEEAWITYLTAIYPVTEQIAKQIVLIAKTLEAQS
ncbi:MAG: hypothetical protein WC374_13425 [Phycisphaerae bacterium]|jgi:hypothetical protein